MKMNEKTYAITMRRGDSESLSVQCTSDPYTAGDTITFTVREDAEGDILLQKVVDTFQSGVAVIAIESGDTTGIEFGDYVYDIQQTDQYGKVLTIVPPDPGSALPKFKLTEEATY